MPIKMKLLTSVAALSLIGGATFAQESTATEQPAAEMAQNEFPQGWNKNLDTTYDAIADTRVAELIGMNVITEAGDEVGEVDNFVLMEDRVQAVVGVGGYIGLGEHHVALPLDELAYDGEKLVISYTQEELEAMPAYTAELEQTAFADGDTFRTRGAPVMDGAEKVAEGDIEIATDEDSTVIDMAEDTLGDAAQMADKAAEQTGDKVKQASEEVAEAAKSAGDALEETAENTVEETGEAIDEGAEKVAAAADSAAGIADEWGEQLSGKFAEIADAPLSELTTYPVATANGETIGEIEALARHDEKVVALVGVGGFLGIGEHDVALDLNALSFDGEKFIAEGYTEAELEALPEYDEESIEPLEGDVTLRTAL